jgi:L-ribulokinase
VTTSGYSLGLDFGTNSVRALIADVATGAEVGTAVAAYLEGRNGVLVDARDPNLARQHPEDYTRALALAVREALASARGTAGFAPDRVCGIGVDATASTPIPVDGACRPLASRPEFAGNLDACAWLWKDHTAHVEAAEITARAGREHPEYLAHCGGSYSSEWYFAKLLRCLRVAPAVLQAADGWVEQGDFIVAALTAAASPRLVKRGVCAAGHKAMFDEGRGLPALEFLSGVDQRLGAWCRGRLYERAHGAHESAGGLSAAWAERLGLPVGTPVAVASIDAHTGAVGAGIRPGVLVKILGTSACDMLVHPAAEPLADIPGIAGIVPGSILPGHYGLEAGQAACGDLFGWFVGQFGAPAGLSHEALTAAAAGLAPGESGLLALDWNNGNRSVLADPRLTGLLVGQTLHTTPTEVYRALLEAAACGARLIMERFEEYGVRVDEVVACGGLAGKNPLFLQIFADVTGRPLKLSRSAQTCALGAAIHGAVAAGAARGGHASVAAAQAVMCGLKATIYHPRAHARAAYDEIYRLYVLLHDAFGGRGAAAAPATVMKRLITLRESVRQGARREA